MLKTLAIGAVAASALTLAGPTHAAVSLSFSDFTSGVDFNPLFGSSNVSISSADNAVTVFGGGDNDGSIIDTNGGSSDGTVGYNPYGPYALSQWLSIGGAGGTSFNGNGYAQATLSFTGAQNSLSFVWGSPSWSNMVTLYNAQNQVVDTALAYGNGEIDGYDSSNNWNSQIMDPALADTDGLGELVTINSSIAFTTAVLSTNDGAGGFEVGDISAVPLPPGLPMFGAALLGLGLLGARKRKILA